MFVCLFFLLVWLFMHLFVCLFVCLLFLLYIVYRRHVLCCQMGDKLTALLILTTLPPLSHIKIFFCPFYCTWLLQFFFFLFPIFWYMFFWFFLSIAVASILSFDIFISFLKGLGLKFTVSKGCSETHFLDVLFHFSHLVLVFVLGCLYNAAFTLVPERLFLPLKEGPSNAQKTKSYLREANQLTF